MKTLDLDNELVAPKTFAHPTRLHDIYRELRQSDPVHWTQPDGYRPFWTVTKHADIMETERQSDIFLNDPRTTLLSCQEEASIKEFTGGSHIIIRSLVHMDNPDHTALRKLTQSWFMPPNLKKLESNLVHLSREVVRRMKQRGEQCDFVSDVAVWYPLRVIMNILGVPEEDEPLMLKLTQELFGSSDPEMQREKKEENALDFSVVTDFFNYFTKMTEERRKNPTDDVASVIANATVHGEPVSHIDAMGYYIIVATAGHDTTSSSIAGFLHALIEHPEQMAELRADLDLLPNAIEEAIRWTTPVKHFFRTATRDYELRGKKIKAGDSLLMCYPSGNRDEDVFEDPFVFNIRRKPNKHIAFGYGSHLCLGMHLARMEIRALYSELLPHLDHIELSGTPSWVAASFVSGLKSLPVRYQFHQEAG